MSVDALCTDVMIDGLVSQNCSLDGDTVIIEMIPAPKWPPYAKPALSPSQQAERKPEMNDMPIENRLVDNYYAEDTS